jgi:hypothetical protein
MNRAALSLCLCGAALATANILIMLRPTCPSGGAEVVTAYKETPPAAVSTTQGKPAQAPKAAKKPAQAPKNEAANPAQGKPQQTPKAATTKPAAARKDVEPTGSVNETDKTQAPNGKAPQPKPAKTRKLPNPAPEPKDVDVIGSHQTKTPRASGKAPASVSGGQSAEARDRPAKVEHEPEEWVEVSLAAKVHNAPSVSSPTIRYYRVGIRLKVIGRAPGWIKVVDPTTSKEGWIYEKYLTPKEAPDKKQAGVPQQSPKSAQAGSETPDDPNLVAPTKPGFYQRQRKYGWRRHYGYYGPPPGFGIRVYPGW